MFCLETEKILVVEFYDIRLINGIDSNELTSCLPVMSESFYHKVDYSSSYSMMLKIFGSSEMPYVHGGI